MANRRRCVHCVFYLVDTIFLYTSTILAGENYFPPSGSFFHIHITCNCSCYWKPFFYQMEIFFHLLFIPVIGNHVSIYGKPFQFICNLFLLVKTDFLSRVKDFLSFFIHPAGVNLFFVYCKPFSAIFCLFLVVEIIFLSCGTSSH